MTSVDLAVFVLRVAAGAMICMHGWNHVYGGGKIAGTARWFGSMGMRPPLVQAWMASLTEVGAGLLLIVGFLTPLAAAGLLGVMTVAFVIAHRKNGFFIFNKDQGWEYVMIVGACAFAIGAIGGGKWSLDNAFDTAFTGTWTGAIVAAAGGFGGAALLLATCWRPAKK